MFQKVFLKKKTARLSWKSIEKKMSQWTNRSLDINTAIATPKGCQKALFITI